jgi:hypothetical protein
MRKYIILFFSALLFLFACKWSQTPNGILQPDKMVNVLVAVHLVDASLNNIDAPNPDSLYKYGLGRYLAMFKRMHTDSTQFKTSLKYYTQHPDQMEIMYVEVVKKLQDKNDSINKAMLPPKQKNALPKK